MSRLLIAALALAGCADIGPFRARSSDDSSDGGLTGGDASGDGANATDANENHVVSPELLADTVPEEYYLATSGGALFWVEYGSTTSIARLPVAGGQVKRLTVADSPGLLTSADGLAFWTTSGGVMVANSALTAASPLATSSEVVMSIAVSSQHVYFAHQVSSTWTLERVPRAGGTSEPLYTGLIDTPSFGAGTSSLYWNNSGELRRSAFSSPATYDVETTGASNALYVGGATTCWITQPDINFYLYDVWCEHQGQKTKISTGNSQVFDLDVGDDAVLIAARLDSWTGRIRRYDFATHQLTTPYTASTGGIPTSVVRDANYMYWLENHGVWRQALH